MTEMCDLCPRTTVTHVPSLYKRGGVSPWFLGVSPLWKNRGDAAPLGNLSLCAA